MPTRLQHLNALRDHLNGVLSRRIASEHSQRCIGLNPQAHANLYWLRQSPFAYRDTIGAGLVLAFGDGCAGRAMPRRLRSPLDGSWVRVESVRGGRAGQMQSIEVSNDSAPALTGTLGGILRSKSNPRQLLALTAGHVLGSSPAARAGNAVLLSGNEDMFGRLLNWLPDFVHVPPKTRIDAGLAVLDSEMLEPLARQQREWPVRAAEPFVNSDLRIRTRDAVFPGSGQEYLSCQMGLSETTFYTVEDALCWDVAEPTQPGDSGAPIWNGQDELIAIHTGTAPAGARKNAVAIPIGRILNWAGASVVPRGQALAQTPLPQNGMLLTGETLSLKPPPPQPLPGSPPPAGATQFTPEVDTLARTMWGEARGDGTDGMSAVAHVVLNRRAAKKYWGLTIQDVCRKPFQFSCWNDNDPNKPLLQRLTPADASFSLALKLAQELVSLQDPARRARDTTMGATHYYASRLQPPPRWARGKTPCARIGRQLFFSDIA